MRAPPTAKRHGSGPTRLRLANSTCGLLTGAFLPALLERSQRIDQAIFAVVMEAYLRGVSTRKVETQVKALGAHTGISK